MTETPTDPPRVLSLAEVADRLGMKRPNVAKFLARRGVTPAISKAQGYFWWEADIDRVKAEREADAEQMASDERRRAGALRNADNGDQPAAPPPAAARLGPRQRVVLQMLTYRPVRTDDNAIRLAMRRLHERGLVEPTPNEPGYWRLTDTGREVIGAL